MASVEVRKIKERRLHNLKKLLVLIALLVVASMLIPSAVFAADPTSMVVNWSGGGVVNGTFTNKNDATYSFNVNANGASGTFTANGLNDNPFSYNVDSSNAYIKCSVSGGGFTNFIAQRTDSYSGMYGSAGQLAYSSILADIGSAEMATGSSNNYAQMVNGTYGKPWTTNGANFEANSDNYAIYSFIGKSATIDSNYNITPSDNWAEFSVVGSGTAKINDMTNEASGCWPLKLGYGGGCYTNAKALLTGSGIFAVNAVGTNSITVPGDVGGLTIPGAGYGTTSYSLVVNYAGATSGSPFSYSNFSVKVQ